MLQREKSHALRAIRHTITSLAKTATPEEQERVEGRIILVGYSLALDPSLSMSVREAALSIAVGWERAQEDPTYRPVDEVTAGRVLLNRLANNPDYEAADARTKKGFTIRRTTLSRALHILSQEA